MILHGLTGTRTGSEYRRRSRWQRTWCAPANVLVSGPLSTTPLMIVIVVVALVAPAIGQGDPSADETLRGLTGVNVLVEDLPVEPAAEQVGLTPATLRSDIETQLREAGIHVLTDDEWQAAPGRPWLFIRVRIIRPDATSAYTYVIALELMQRTMLTREPSLETDAMTWTTGAIGTGGGPTLTMVRERLHAEVDTFIRAYRAVNPTR